MRPLREPLVLLQVLFNISARLNLGVYGGRTYLGGRVISECEPIDAASKVEHQVHRIRFQNGRELELIERPLVVIRGRRQRLFLGWDRERGRATEDITVPVHAGRGVPLGALPHLVTCFEIDGRRVRLYAWRHSWTEILCSPSYSMQRLFDGRPDEVRLVNAEDVHAGQLLAVRHPLTPVEMVWQCASAGISSGDFALPYERPSGREWDYPRFRPLKPLQVLTGRRWREVVEGARWRYFEELFPEGLESFGDSPAAVLQASLRRPADVNPPAKPRFWQAVEPLLATDREALLGEVIELRRGDLSSLWLGQRGERGPVMVFDSRDNARLLASGRGDLEMLRRQSLLDLTTSGKGPERLGLLLRLGVTQARMDGVRLEAY